MTFSGFVASARKALAGGFTAFVAAIVPAARDGVITDGDWLTIGLATIAGVVAVYYVPNTPPTPPAAPEYVGEHEAKL